jgi:thioredoxin reductase (NADPH)
VHRRDQLRAEKIAQDRLFKNPKISVIWNSEIDEILGQEQPFKQVTGVRLKNTQTGDCQTIQADGIFIAIGHTPMSSIFAGKIDTDQEGYIKVRIGTTQTSLPGVFAAGDVQDKVFRQAVTAAGQGCMAALEAEKFLSHA